jgi:hypothetical protein
MSWKDSGFAALTSAVAHTARLRVEYAAGLVVVADATSAGIGTVKYNTAAGDPVGVALMNKPGTHEMVASEAIADGADVYAAAGGKVCALPVAAGTYYKVGIALSAAGEDGDIIEVLPVEYGKAVTV